MVSDNYIIRESERESIKRRIYVLYILQCRRTSTYRSRKYYKSRRIKFVHLVKMSRLDPVSRLIANAVLETTIDQLAIVGGTLPAPPSASGGDDGATVAAATESVGNVNTTSKALVDILPLERKQIQQNSSTSSSAADELNGEKVASLRRLAIETSYVQRVLEDTLDEINEDGTYASLTESVAKSRERDREKKKIRYAL